MVSEQIAVGCGYDIRFVDAVDSLYVFQVVTPCAALREYLAHQPCTGRNSFQFILDTTQHDLFQFCQLLITEIASLHTFYLLPAEALSLFLAAERYLGNNQQPYNTRLVQ